MTVRDSGESPNNTNSELMKISTVSNKFDFYNETKFK